MSDEEEIALAKSLPKGSQRTLALLTRKPTYPGRETFNASAAFNLCWRARKHGGLAAFRVIEKRAAYYITPLGERIRDRLAQEKAA